MTNKQDLTALAERVERASGPDRELDLAIAIAIGKVPASTIRGGVTGFCYFDKHGSPCCVTVATFTASLDAALTLVPEGMIWMLTNSGLDHPTKPDFTKSSAVVAEWQSTEPMDDRTGANPALALTAASLRARARSA